MLCSLANLDKGKLEAIETFEKKTGKIVLAFTCKDINIGKLNAQELAELKAVEKKLGLSLVAVQ